jgi:hypothetical protein
VVQKYDEAHVKNADAALVSATAGNDTRKWIERARPRLRVPPASAVTHTHPVPHPPLDLLQPPFRQLFSFQLILFPSIFSSVSTNSRSLHIALPPPHRFRSLDLNLKPVSLSIHFCRWCMTRCASASQYQLRRAWVRVGRYCVTAFLPPPPRFPIACSHPGPGPEHRWRYASSSAWGGVVKCSSILLLRFRVPRGPAHPTRLGARGGFEVGESSFHSYTPVTPTGEPRKRSARPDGSRSVPRSLRCGLWSWTHICAHGALWGRRGGMRMGSPRGWRGGAGQTSPRWGACSMVGKTVLRSSSAKSPVRGAADRARKSCWATSCE